jgi:hypothetical protein
LSGKVPQTYNVGLLVFFAEGFSMPGNLPENMSMATIPTITDIAIVTVLKIIFLSRKLGISYKSF